MKKLQIDALESEIEKLSSMLLEQADFDPLGSLSLKSRLDDLQSELAELKDREDNLASVALLFYGEPVSGSYGIDAEFAGRAIQEYQAALSKHMVSVAGGSMGSRGPIPERQLSKLNITNVVQGSFGFQLEEASDGTIDMFGTALKTAVDDLTQFLEGIVNKDERKFQEVMDKIDSRTFLSVKSLLSLVHNAEASFRVVDENDDHAFDVERIHRGYERLQSVELAEEQTSITGRLLGIIPVGRRFEFEIGDTKEVIDGSVGERLSADFLEQIQGDEERYIGHMWRALFQMRTIKKPGQDEKTKYILMDLLDKVDP